MSTEELKETTEEITNTEAVTETVTVEEALESVSEENKEEVQTEVQEEKTEDVNRVLPIGDAIYELDIQIKPNDLFDYMLRHTYSSFMGLFSTILGAMMIILYFGKEGVSALYLICGLLVVFYLPVNLFMMSRKQALQENFKKPLHYAFYENGFEVSQGDIHQLQEWKYVVKAIATSNSIIVYTGKNVASIFPRRDLTPDATALIQVLSTHVDPKKMKIKQ